MTTVTRYLPITAKFDGCFCSKECQHFINCYDDDEQEVCFCSVTPITMLVEFGYPKWETPCNIKHSIISSNNRIRTRWCCETFGMGDEPIQEPETYMHEVLKGWVNE